MNCKCEEFVTNLNSSLIEGVPKVTTEFKVNEEKRTVVCIMTTVNDMANRLKKYGLEDEKYDDYDFDIREYVGVAKCAPQDQWNETYGRRLAEYRAALMRRADINNEITNFAKGICHCIDDLCNFGKLKKPHAPNRDEC